MKDQEYLYPGAEFGYFSSFFLYAAERIHRLAISALGNYKYVPINKSSFTYKEKVFKYLRAKYAATVYESQQASKKKFTDYDMQVGITNNFEKLSSMKDCFLKMRTNIEAAQDKLSQLQASKKFIKSNFFNEVAFEFDKQRYSSIAWGLIIGAFICTTFYRKGSITRQAALFLTCGHAMGQISYHISINKYFDTISTIFEEDVAQYQRIEKQAKQKQRNTDSAGHVED